jgi:predicted RNA-binding Zn-ribbon protein involved in translation (DUF1610 family)
MTEKSEMVKCPKCKGEGIVRCTECDGKGFEVTDHVGWISGGQIYEKDIWEACPSCDNALDDGHLYCPLCEGNETVSKQELIDYEDKNK